MNSESAKEAATGNTLVNKMALDLRLEHASVITFTGFGGLLTALRENMRE